MPQSTVVEVDGVFVWEYTDIHTDRGVSPHLRNVIVGKAKLIQH